MKWKEVPFSNSRAGRGWCVSTNTGCLKGGVSPHQPFQSSFAQGPRRGLNMLRPMMEAPTPSKLVAA